MLTRVTQEKSTVGEEAEPLKLKAQTSLDSGGHTADAPNRVLLKSGMKGTSVGVSAAHIAENTEGVCDQQMLEWGRLLLFVLGEAVVESV